MIYILTAILIELKKKTKNQPSRTTNEKNNSQIIYYASVGVKTKNKGLTIRAKHAVRIPLPDPTSRALAPSCN